MPETQKTIGFNILATNDNGALRLVIDPGKTNGRSKSGKSEVIASTGGNVDLAELGFPGLKMGLNIYRPV